MTLKVWFVNKLSVENQMGVTSVHNESQKGTNATDFAQC